jgi:hypothetical protein
MGAQCRLPTFAHKVLFTNSENLIAPSVDEIRRTDRKADQVADVSFPRKLLQ